MKISVVIPLYNEVDNVAPLVEELMPVISGLDPDAEVLLVDDGSTDETGKRIREVGRDWPRSVRHFTLGRHSGQTAAIDAGFRHARGELIILMDGDLQIDPADIPMMVEHARDFDVVHGWRWQRSDSFFKRVQTRIANLIRNRLTGSDVHDTGCPLKVFRREVIREMKLLNGMHRFLVTLARMDGFRTLEVKVGHRPRRAGQSKYGLWNRALRGLRDLFGVRWMIARSYRLDCTEEELEAAARETPRLRPEPTLEAPQKERGFSDGGG